MTVSMTELMRRVRNAFVSGSVEGRWTVTEGVLSPAPRPGWIAVEGRGALPVDGEGRVELPDGAFEGTIWLLDPPEDFQRLLGEINGWLEAREASGGLTEPVVTRRRESFGVYATETAYSVPEARTGSASGWESVFRDRLLPYRRMFSEVRL